MSQTSSAADVAIISREDLRAALRVHDVTLVDVLSPESFAATHLPGALNLPVADLVRRASAVLPDRRATIVVYCGGPT